MTWSQWRRAKASQYFIDKFSQPEGWWMQDSPVMEFYAQAHSWYYVRPAFNEAIREGLI